MTKACNGFAFQLSRRQLLVRSTILAGGAAVGSAHVLAAAGDDGSGISRNAEAIHQEVAFKASAKRVYDALTDAKQFQKVVSLSGASATMKSLDMDAHPATIDGTPGGAFSLFGGYVTGRQIELVENERIVQAWRAGSWEPGDFSIARFELKEEGAATKLVFDHTGFPAGTAEHLAAGWHSNYWEPLASFLGGE